MQRKDETMKKAWCIDCGSVTLTVVLLLCLPFSASADLLLGPEELVQANSININVSGYSVPSFVFWDGDTLMDLVVGEGGGGIAEAKVRVYLNVGTAQNPTFIDYFYAQSEGSDLISPGSG